MKIEDLFIFGDGAGAAVISQLIIKMKLIDVNCSSDGNHEDLIKTPGGGSKNHAARSS